MIFSDWEDFRSSSTCSPSPSEFAAHTSSRTPNLGKESPTNAKLQDCPAHQECPLSQLYRRGNPKMFVLKKTTNLNRYDRGLCTITYHSHSWEHRSYTYYKPSNCYRGTFLFLSFILLHGVVEVRIFVFPVCVFFFYFARRLIFSSFPMLSSDVKQTCTYCLLKKSLLRAVVLLGTCQNNTF